MPYATNRDRNTTQLELSKTPWPLPPLNLFLTSGWSPGTFNLRWDNPSILPLNAKWEIIGVNLYRSFDSEFGPYHRLNDLPISSLCWHDFTQIEVIVEEPVTKWVLFGWPSSEARIPQFVFKTHHYPIVKSGTQGTPSDNPLDVHVYINDKKANIFSVFGAGGEIQIDPREFPNVSTQNYDPTVVPSANDRVTVTYKRLRSLLKTDMVQRVFYKVTTVALRNDCEASCAKASDLIETPIDKATKTNSYEIEKLDWIWKEAIRRNRWILEQGGERVQVFLKKHHGHPCPCIPNSHTKQPVGDCLLCFGTGFIGGYEGPFETIIGPDDAEKIKRRTERGETVEHTYDVYTGPVPLLSQRDFIVKLNGDRYSIGPVRIPSNRGAVLQQHFGINHLDEKDIRYKVPVSDPIKCVATQHKPEGPENGGPRPITEKTNIEDERELRGRTLAWENITY